jgi:peptidylprolyl isomerase
MIRILAVLAALVCAAPALAQPLPAGVDKANAVVIDTTKGRIVIKLRTDLAPEHAERIKTLAREGYYNNVPFHRVIEGFMAQGGDPTGTGTGGSDLGNIRAEFSNSAKFVRGTCGMARSQSPNSANSQFFIMFEPAPHLNGQYTIWGQVVKGMEFVDQIKRGSGGGGTVSDPDKIVKFSVAADAA